MQRKHWFTLPTLLALAFPAMLTNCAAEAPTDPGTGGVGGSAGTTNAGAAGAASGGTAPGTGGTSVSGAGGSAGSDTTTGGSAGSGVAGNGAAGAGMAGTGAGSGAAGTGTAGTGAAGNGAGGSSAGSGGSAQGGTAGSAAAGTSGTGTGAGGYNTDPACMGIKNDMPCTTQDLQCENLRCGLSDLGRRTCACSTNWTCMSCAFPAGAPQEVVGMPAGELSACDASVVKGDPCTTQGDRCQPTEAGDVCACWPIGGTLEWDCDSKPWE